MSLNIMQNGEESDLLSSLFLSFLYSCISRGYPDQVERRYAKVVNSEWIDAERESERE